MLERICPAITEKTARLRKPISPEKTLAVTLRYLVATGEFCSRAHRRSYHPSLSQKNAQKSLITSEKYAPVVSTFKLLSKC